jgi:hypothetical protein
MTVNFVRFAELLWDIDVVQNVRRIVPDVLAGAIKLAMAAGDVAPADRRLLSLAGQFGALMPGRDADATKMLVLVDGPLGLTAGGYQAIFNAAAECVEAGATVVWAEDLSPLESVADQVVRMSPFRQSIFDRSKEPFFDLRYSRAASNSCPPRAP